MKTYQFYMLDILIVAAWVFIINRYAGRIDFELVLFAIILSCITLVFIAAIRGLIWRAQNGVDLFAKLETNPEVLKLKLLLRMRQSEPQTFVEVCNGIVDEVHNYPQWDILGSRMFKSWYKHNVDYMLQHPMNFDLSELSDGRPYIKENDPFYDIKADLWEGTDWVNIKLDEID